MNTITKSTLLLTVAAMLSSCSTPSGPASSAAGAAAPAAASSGVKPYPLKTCIVSGNDLGSMGDEQRIVYEGQEIKFCCKPCVGKFRKNPAKYLSKL